MPAVFRISKNIRDMDRTLLQNASACQKSALRPPKPPKMRWATYIRLRAVDAALQEQWLIGAADEARAATRDRGQRPLLREQQTRKRQGRWGTRQQLTTGCVKTRALLRFS